MTKLTCGRVVQLWYGSTCTMLWIYEDVRRQQIAVVFQVLSALDPILLPSIVLHIHQISDYLVPAEKNMKIINNLGELVWSSTSSPALQPIWSSITIMSSPIVVNPVSSSKVCMYMVLGLALLVWSCCGCHNTSFDASSRLCSSRARWPMASNFCSQPTRKSLLFHRNHMLCTLDALGSLQFLLGHSLAPPLCV